MQNDFGHATLTAGTRCPSPVHGVPAARDRGQHRGPEGKPRREVLDNPPPSTGPASSTGALRAPSGLRQREPTGGGQEAKTGGLPHGHGAPRRAWLPRRAPGGNERGEGLGPHQHRPPTWEGHRAAGAALLGAPGDAERRRWCPGIAPGCWCPATAAPVPPAGPPGGATGTGAAALPPLLFSSPRPPRATPRGGAACCRVDRPRNQKRNGKGKETEG